MTFQNNLQTIRGYDFIRHRPLFNYTYNGQQESHISSLASSNGYLYVLRKAVKTIDVIKLSDCIKNGVCHVDFSITSETLKAQGLNYFAPMKIITDFSHP